MSGCNYSYNTHHLIIFLYTSGVTMFMHAVYL